VEQTGTESQVQTAVGPCGPRDVAGLGLKLQWVVSGSGRAQCPVTLSGCTDGAVLQGATHQKGAGKGRLCAALGV
jgi:hypothetical protein